MGMSWSYRLIHTDVVSSRKYLSTAMIDGFRRLCCPRLWSKFSSWQKTNMGTILCSTFCRMELPLCGPQS
uniref:APUM3 n=1 Tax=Arundo donax TaxID=35708 RepID=A0A0A8ZAF2_ARUDO